MFLSGIIRKETTLHGRRFLVGLGGIIGLNRVIRIILQDPTFIIVSLREPMQMLVSTISNFLNGRNGITSSAQMKDSVDLLVLM